MQTSEWLEHNHEIGIFRSDHMECCREDAGFIEGKRRAKELNALRTVLSNRAT